MATKVRYQPWECSASFAQHYDEVRQRTAGLLEDWGVRKNTDWPDRARFIRIGQPTLTHAWFDQIVHLGRAGIRLQIPGWKLTELFPNLGWGEYTHDAYAIEKQDGNVHVDGYEPRALSIYIVGMDYVRLVSLGCDHPNAVARAAGQQMTAYHCPDCGHKWGVDTSG